jgi:rRNA maturation endonuclease Nob1
MRCRACTKAVGKSEGKNQKLCQNCYGKELKQIKAKER